MEKIKFKNNYTYVLIANKNHPKYHSGNTCVAVFDKQIDAENWLDKYFKTLGFGSLEEALYNTRIERTKCFRKNKKRNLRKKKV